MAKSFQISWPDGIQGVDRQATVLHNIDLIPWKFGHAPIPSEERFMHQEIQPTKEQVDRANASSVGIVVSEYNDQITGKLCHGAIETLVQAGIARERIVVTRVPGAWELPFATQRLVALRSIAGVIALGAVIKGETSHDQHINRAVSSALMQLSLDHNKPIAFGLLTVNTLEQALHRSGGNKGNKGQECALALLACLRLGKAFDEFQETRDE